MTDGMLLIIDDDPAAQRLMMRGVTGAIALSSAEAALAWIEKNGAPSVAVVDITLPRMSGFELAESLRSSCRVVLAGARPGMELEDEARALELGVDLVEKRHVASTVAPKPKPAGAAAFWSKLVEVFV